MSKLRRVYVWELPLRLFHWANAILIFALCATGFLIGDPPAFMSQKEASFQYTFGIIRYIHFLTAYLFMLNFLFRIYWGFVGNKYSSWRAFLPLTRKFVKDIFDVLRIDIFLQPNKEHLAVGHNALAGFIYFFIFVLMFVQVVTGYGLYASMSQSWFVALFAWVPGAVGGDFFLRNVHHWAMWIFVIFVIIHVYLVLYHDYVEGRGETSSIIGGWKFIEEEALIELNEMRSDEIEVEEEELTT
jgi:Ni/Fe-hydrogenase 1 B-type cytochrome subunit